MSLLDDVSIVVTPNGYKAGELYAVVPVPSEGSDVVTDGNFPDGSTAWALNGWTISGNAANCSGITANMIQNISGSTNKQFVITFTISNYVSGSVIPAFVGGNSYSKVYNANGTFTEVISSYSDIRFVFYATSFDGSVSNVSVKEYTAADMDVTRATAATRVDEDGLVNYAEILGAEEVTNGTFTGITQAELTVGSEWTTGAGWTISGGEAVAATGTSSKLEQSISGLSGKFCKVNLTLSDYGGGGSIYVDFGSTNSSYINTNGEHTVYGTFDQNKFEIFKGGAFSGNVTNVSVKEAARDNVPRIDYTGGGCPHILAEPQRTNIVTYSEDFSDSSWVKSGVTLTSAQISPSGDSSAYKLDFSANNDYIQSAISGLDTSKEYTLSFYAKVQSGTTTIDAGNINGGSYETLTITDEWQRFEVTQTPSGTTRYPRPIRANGSDEIYLWGAQLEEGSYPTSYIPNFGTALGVTRNQDIFTRDGIGSLINDSEGTLYFEGSTFENGGGSNRFISLSDGTSNNLIYIRVDSTASRFRGFARGSSGSYTLITVNSVPQTDNNKIALVWDATNFRIWINGSERATAIINDLPVGMNTLNLTDPTSSDPFFGKVKQLQVYKTALTDTQLAALTS